MKNGINLLTLDEKLKLLTGINRWQTFSAKGKLKSVFMSDGPSGLRKEENGKELFATAMPTLSVLANTWNRELAYLDGKTLGDECNEYNVDVLLAPGINIKRTPLCGRNFEYLSEDPFLAGQLGKEYILGLQSKNVGASLKHYCGNNREFERHHQTSEIDERTLREIYLSAFEIALEAKPWTVMCSYNPINGIYASENKYLLQEILRNDFNYDGVIISDWDAVHSQFRRIRAGLNLEMPYNDKSYLELRNAYDNGLITEEQINYCVEPIIELSKKTIVEKTIEYNSNTRHQNAVKIAEEGIVLLKNEDNILPLNNGKILVCGNFESNPPIGGGGSSNVKTNYQQAGLATLINEKLANATVSFCNKAFINTNGEQWNLKEAIIEAYNSDIVILCVGNDARIDSEGFDRTSIKLPIYHEKMIKEIAEVNKNIIVIVYAGGAIDMSSWINDVKGVIFAGYAGEGINEALASILSGCIVPSGKLSETFPLCIEDTSIGRYPGNYFTENYNDGIFVGYRYYDSYKKQVLFPFGYGLSYANFTYSNLRVNKLGLTDYEVSYDITNNSEFIAKEISQVYVRDVFSMVLRPLKELKGFSKDEIAPQETKTIKLKLNERSFAYYNVALKKWHIENGVFEILVGSSSRDIHLSTKIDIELPEQTQFTTRF